MCCMLLRCGVTETGDETSMREHKVCSGRPLVDHSGSTTLYNNNTSTGRLLSLLLLVVVGKVALLV